MKKPCIFCEGDGKLSKEHIYPNWLKEHLINDDNSSTKHRVTLNQNKPQIGKLQRKINFHKQKLRIVCESCNNGWMSQIQSLAKPHLIPLINGEWDAMTPAAYRAISVWATMFTIVHEYAHPETAMVPKIERHQFKNNQLTPSTWRVWLGKHIDIEDHPAFINHFGFKMQQPKFIQNLQSTGFTVGKLFIQTYMASPSCNLSNAKAEEFSKQFDLIQIFPCNNLEQISIPEIKYSKDNLLFISNYIAKNYRLPAMESLDILT